MHKAVNRFFVALVLLVILSLGYGLNPNDACINPDGESGRCIGFRECEPLMKIYRKSLISPQDSQFVEMSRCGLTADKKILVCCKIKDPVATLPKAPNCGVDLSDRIHGGQQTGLDEFPWTALIEYRHTNGTTGFHCGGSLINSRYILTAAHCVHEVAWQVVGVRLGEWDLSEEHDCDDEICTDAPVDMGIEKIIVHEDYNSKSKSQYNDIALIRFDRDVQMSAYISPVCLPIGEPYRSRNNVGFKGYVTGWGRTENNTASNVKLKVLLEINDLESCAKTYRPAGVIVRDTQMCAGGVRGQDSCNGDSGGSLTKQEQAFIYQYGIVSFGLNKCGIKGVPGVYTSVAKYIDWIESKME